MKAATNTLIISLFDEEDNDFQIKAKPLKAQIESVGFFKDEKNPLLKEGKVVYINPNFRRVEVKDNRFVIREPEILYFED